VNGLGYALPALLSLPAVAVAELVWLRTGLFRTRAYWVSLLIVLAFQVPVDGWLTKSHAPIVRYAPTHLSGWRFPFDIPIEDFAFGAALVTATLLAWTYSERRGATR
jgi:lycopene cyclase domain-containing protein